MSSNSSELTSNKTSEEESIMAIYLDWNPVERRLPPVTEYPWEPQYGYLVTVKQLPYAISASYHYDFDGECIWMFGEFTLEDVIAWVEAPAAYNPSEQLS